MADPQLRLEAPLNILSIAILQLVVLARRGCLFSQKVPLEYLYPPLEFGAILTSDERVCVDYFDEREYYELKLPCNLEYSIPFLTGLLALVPPASRIRVLTCKPLVDTLQQVLMSIFLPSTLHIKRLDANGLVLTKLDRSELRQHINISDKLIKRGFFAYLCGVANVLGIELKIKLPLCIDDVELLDTLLYLKQHGLVDFEIASSEASKGVFEVSITIMGGFERVTFSRPNNVLLVFTATPLLRKLLRLLHIKKLYVEPVVCGLIDRRLCESVGVNCANNKLIIEGSKEFVKHVCMKNIVNTLQLDVISKIILQCLCTLVKTHLNASLCKTYLCDVCRSSFETLACITYTLSKGTICCLECLKAFWPSLHRLLQKLPIISP